MCYYFREKLHIDHFCVLKVEIEALLDRTAWREKWTWFTPHDIMKLNQNQIEITTANQSRENMTGSQWELEVKQANCMKRDWPSRTWF